MRGQHQHAACGKVRGAQGAYARDCLFIQCGEWFVQQPKRHGGRKREAGEGGALALPLRQVPRRQAGEACDAQLLKCSCAIGILDLRRNRLVVSRDRFGIKPVYWKIGKDGAILFASEIKQILAATEAEPPKANRPLIAAYLRGFRYPTHGGFVSYLKRFMESSDLRLGHKLKSIDPKKKEVKFANDVTVPYKALVSSVPLPDLICMLNKEVALPVERCRVSAM